MSGGRSNQKTFDESVDGLQIQRTVGAFLCHEESAPRQQTVLHVKVVIHKLEKRSKSRLAKSQLLNLVNN